MGNKKYLDKVLGSLIRSTSFNPTKREVSSPFHHEDDIIPSYGSFVIYCRNQFGLTHYEIVNMWYDYIEFLRKEVGYGQ